MIPKLTVTAFTSDVPLVPAPFLEDEWGCQPGTLFIPERREDFVQSVRQPDGTVNVTYNFVYRPKERRAGGE